MDRTKKIKSFEQFKTAWGKTTHYRQLVELNQMSPELYASYKERLEKEQLKEKDPVSFYLQYGVNATVKGV